MQSSDQFDAVQRQERWRRWAKTLVKGVSVIALIVSLLALCTLISKTATNTLPGGYVLLTDVGTAIQLHSDLQALLLAAVAHVPGLFLLVNGLWQRKSGARVIHFQRDAWRCISKDKHKRQSQKHRDPHLRPKGLTLSRVFAQ